MFILAMMVAATVCHGQIFIESVNATYDGKVYKFIDNHQHLEVRYAGDFKFNYYTTRTGQLTEEQVEMLSKVNYDALKEYKRVLKRTYEGCTADYTKEFNGCAKSLNKNYEDDSDLTYIAVFHKGIIRIYVCAGEYAFFTENMPYEQFNKVKIEYNRAVKQQEINFNFEKTMENFDFSKEVSLYLQSQSTLTDK